MKLYEKFQNLSRGRQIGCTVLFVHFLCVFALTIHHWIVNHPPKRPIAVHTRQIALQPKTTPPVTTPVTTPVTPKTAPKKQAPTPKPSPPKAAKKTTSPAPANKPGKPSPAKKVTKEVPKIAPEPVVQEEVVTTTFTKTALSLPSLIDTPLSTEEPITDPTYEELLIATFQSALDLPEMGEVRARLEIDRMGRLVSCTILETKSRKNEEFLKNRLPDLLFPCFNSGDIQSFTVTFRNAEKR